MKPEEIITILEWRTAKRVLADRGLSARIAGVDIAALLVTCNHARRVAEVCTKTTDWNASGRGDPSLSTDPVTPCVNFGKTTSKPNRTATESKKQLPDGYCSVRLLI